MRGPAPTKSARRARDELPDFAKDVIGDSHIEIEPPEGLSPDALAVWQRVVPVASADGLLRHADRDLLAYYCRLVAHLEAALTRLEHLTAAAASEQDIGRAFRRVRDTLAMVVKLSDQLALSPEARWRFGIGTAKETSLLALLPSQHENDEHREGDSNAAAQEDE